MSEEHALAIAAGGDQDPDKCTIIRQDDNTEQIEKYVMEGILQAGGGDYFSNVVFDPRLSGWFAQLGWTPPFFEYLKIEVPCSPGALAGGKEVIPADYLALYKSYGSTEAQLDVVRGVLRRGYMKGTHTDILVRPEALKVALPVGPCYVDGTNKQMVHIAALALQIPSDYPVPVLLKVVPLVMMCLVKKLLEHHEVKAFDRKFSVIEFDLRETFGQTRHRVFYARLAPALSERNKDHCRVAYPLIGTPAYLKMMQKPAVVVKK